VLRYLQGTSCLGLKYQSDGTDSAQIVGYCDASWANDPDTRKSVTGYVFFLAGGPISWSSKRQPTVALSTAEAEYMALSAAAQEAKWLSMFMGELGFQQDTITIYSDNQSAIAIANNPVHHARTKHIDLRHHFIRECVENNIIMLKYITSAKQIADIFTKPLNGPTFTQHANSLVIELTHN
jgi:ribonuclease HI